MQVLDEDCSSGLVVWVAVGVVMEGFAGTGWGASWGWAEVVIGGVGYWAVVEELGLWDWVCWDDGKVDWVVG